MANTLNLSRAAERLGISQPSLTLSIQRLESAVGAQVLLRNKRGVSLTPPGRQIFQQAKRLLETWEQVRVESLASITQVQGTFTIGCHQSVALYSLGGVLPEILEAHPKLDIHLKHDLSRKITESVISGSIDMGIVVNPVRHPDLIIHKLCEDKVTLWAADGKRSIQDIESGEAILLCDQDLLQSQALMKQLKKAGITIKRTMNSSSLEVVANLTASGCGIGILPTRVAEALGNKKLKLVPKAPVFLDEVCLLYRVENKGIRAFQAIGDATKEFFKKG